MAPLAAVSGCETANRAPAATRSGTAADTPHSAASSSADEPSPPQGTFGSAPLASNSSTVAIAPTRRASTRGVRSWASLAFMSHAAPASSSAVQAETMPDSAAQCSGVGTRPVRDAAAARAPRASSACMVAPLPDQHAMWSAVQPAESSVVAVTGGAENEADNVDLASRMELTHSARPQCAARKRGLYAVSPRRWGASEAPACSNVCTTTSWPCDDASCSGVTSLLPPPLTFAPAASSARTAAS